MLAGKWHFEAVFVLVILQANRGCAGLRYCTERMNR